MEKYRRKAMKETGCYIQKASTYDERRTRVAEIRTLRSVLMLGTGAFHVFGLSTSVIIMLLVIVCVPFKTCGQLD